MVNITEVKETKSIKTVVPIDHNYHVFHTASAAAWERGRTLEYWRYRKAWNENPKRHIAGRFPMHLDIEATSACNLRCRMCPRTEMVDRGEFWKVQHFDYDLYTRLIDEGAEKGLCSIKFNYLGEPLLNPRLCEMIQYAKSRGVVDVMLNTNAVLLSDDLSRDLIGSGLDKIFFSFDSPYRDRYNDIRRGAEYNDVFANIKRFVEIRDEMGCVNPLTRASMVRTRDNDVEWEDFIKLFSPIVDAVAYVDYIEHVGQTTDLGVVQNIELTAEPACNNGVAFCCPQLWQRIFVHPDGIVTVCCPDSARTLSLGSIVNFTVEEIWNGAQYDWLREKHSTGQGCEIDTCRRCHLARDFAKPSR